MRVLQSLFLSTVIVVDACQPFLFRSCMFNRLLSRSDLVRGDLRFEPGHAFGCLGLGLLLGENDTGVLGRLVLRHSIVLRCHPLYRSVVCLLCPLQLSRMRVLHSIFLSTVIIVGAC